MKHKVFRFGKSGHNGGRFETEPYDPEKQKAVIRQSICTGEKVAGFKDKKSGAFTEVMLIKTPKDEEKFKEMYGVEKLPVEY